MFTGLKSAARLLRPGLGLKRWLAPLLIGLIILGLGLGLFLGELYAENNLRLAATALGRVLPPWLVAVLLSSTGLATVVFCLYQLNKIVLETFLPEKATVAYVAKQVYHRQRRRRQGPKVAAIGGGTGLSVLLRGLKHHTDNITAIVTVADDGGSSGKLRRELGVLPPGDFRNCIAALADDEALTTQLFQYRFRSGPGLEGHSFGNLFITAMAEVTGSFERALSESGRVLAIRGDIFPSTLENVTLLAELDEGARTRKVMGESVIPETRLPIERVYLQPDEPRAFPPAIQAILNADIIVAGPGSLYTSVIPNLLVAEIAEAIRVSPAPKIYICNVATQPGETDGYAVDDHVRAIEAHTSVIENVVAAASGYSSQPALAPGLTRPKPLFGYTLANNNLEHPIPPARNLQPVIAAPPADRSYTIIEADVVDEQHPWRHDPVKLANALLAWYAAIKSSSAGAR
ncbi:MAG: gluconeogenesis factor YvcK family protein [Chloroflexota bacterium]